MNRLSLTSAELALLLVSLPADPRPFIESSDLVGVDSTVLYRRMEAARNGLLARRLATVREDNSLEVAEPVHAILTALHQPAAGFQPMHAWAGMPAERTFFSISPDMIVFDLRRATPEATQAAMRGSIASGYGFSPSRYWPSACV